MALLVTRRRGGETLPSREFEDVYDRLGQLMSAALGETEGGVMGPWIPMADVSETENSFVVEVDVPGVSKDQIDVQLSERELIVSGQIEEREHERRHRKTRRTGRFELRTLLPGDVDDERVDARLHDGVLTLTIPKAEAAKPRHIEISA
ncbi:Hsp20/alpha crystallin family protein [Nonomuraea cavernae]|uniref:Heat-shock protein Hsp20 n=1 Tax=Nonomuraea cavernae TaxID=2045107 RepID=A0A917YWE0_9ACTN|nr:Hsp20/alpha crystallin family protein [Nonomuraea cavernae]MCA2187294.1 Hsp20/alpha crystallin family protein [Nonomuraea cavernae]GGO68175.1 heat-shock protein Hsp20 [Nonomuraea cavernae]